MVDCRGFNIVPCLPHTSLVQGRHYLSYIAPECLQCKQAIYTDSRKTSEIELANLWTERAADKETGNELKYDTKPKNSIDNGNSTDSEFNMILT